MKTDKLVSKFPRIRDKSVEFQRNAIQLSRNYAFEQLTFLGYFWRFQVLPALCFLLVLGLPWLAFDYSDLKFIGFAVVASFIAYRVDRLVYFRMINRGLTVFLSDPHGMHDIPRKPFVIDTIHRCGAPDGWMPKIKPTTNTE